MFAHAFIVSDFRYIRQCAQNSLTQDHGGLHKGGGVQKVFFARDGCGFQGFLNFEESQGLCLIANVTLC